MDYPALQATADRLLRENGQLVTLTKISTAFDPSTGNAPQTPTSYSVWAALLAYRLKDIDGTNILQGDAKLIMSALQDSGAALPAPMKGDKLTILGATWKVIYVLPLAPAGTVVKYEAQIRK